MSASPVRVPTKKLLSGAEIPSIGLGVFQSLPGKETYNAVLAALKLGYRHIDTAQVYRNEADVGQAVRDSELPRQEVFVTSKIVLPAWSYARTIDSVRESNRKLGLGYIDLFLIHAPLDSHNRSEAWRALEDLQTEGILRDIGVSNFGEAHLKKLAETWRVTPAVNQIELHPWLMRKDTVKYCEDQGILLEAYSPLAQAIRIRDPTVLEVARQVSGSAAQVLIAWSLAKGFVTLPKSVREARIQENLESTNVTLSKEQIETLDGLDEYLVTAWDPIKDHAV